MLDRLEQMEQRFNDLQAQYALPEVLNDHEKYQKIGKSLREIEEPVEKYRDYDFLVSVKKPMGRRLIS